jgi:mono/diheme cytochrome c family protein
VRAFVLFISPGIVLLFIAIPGLLTPQPASHPPNSATVTPDRLAAPPTVASPTQADEGAQVYWLNCQPCHGDRGQGLTDEWRAQYPPEDQNCWDSGCHGRNPYEDGFKLPEFVPALIGPQALARFDTAQSLHAFISSKMPFQAPASLRGEEYWQLTAYLLRANGVGWGDQSLDAALAPNVRLRPEPRAEPAEAPDSLNARWVGWLGIGLGVGGISLALWGWRKRKNSQRR